MKLKERIEAFVQLRQVINLLKEDEIALINSNAASHNNWFTADSVQLAFHGIQHLLREENLTRWVAGYSLQPANIKKIGLVMAGNIPLVGFHDLLSVLISGHSLFIKLSSQDQFLPHFIIKKLLDIEPRFNSQIEIVERLTGMDAIIATGSNNSSRYFEYYFAKIPHIIRKNRTSCAVLTGNETEPELSDLGKDVFQYYGLGCRNVSKLFVPPNYNFRKLIENWETYEYVSFNHKYHNNYDYNKSIYLINKERHLDTGFLLLKETAELVSPIAVLYYEHYTHIEKLLSKLENEKEKIQCTVAGQNTLPGAIRFGNSQYPELKDYADNVDTLNFLSKL